MPLSGEDHQLVKRALFLIETLAHMGTFRDKPDVHNECVYLSEGLRDLLRMPRTETR